ncbi:leucine-rich repeat domain-containing protein [Faecalibacterium sp.]|uniref:leucine-rich repeat domain-containing protein n=1 Tax=Faecalibacterium sp. TaxID=1971605 RepID=UPI003A8DFDD1
MTPVRKLYLDNIRWMTVVLVVIYHVVYKPNLVRVECQNNQLTSLILGENKMLEKLNCANNQLTQLNLNNMSSLKELNCANNQLTVLDVSSSPDLTKLWLKNNQLTSLNLDNNLNLNFTYTDICNSDFNNVYTVTLTPDRTFDLSTLPGNFDKSRVTGWEHGKANGNILTVDEGTNVVYYAYKCRSDIMAASFKLDVTGTGGGSTGGGDGGAGIAVLAIGGVAVAGLVGYGVYSYVSEQQLKALLPEGVAVPENRAQTALLLWNTAGRPEPAAQPAFPDVADPDTAKAAQWCVEQGLMNLKFRGRFAPDGSSPAYKTLNAYRQLVG